MQKKKTAFLVFLYFILLLFFLRCNGADETVGQKRRVCSTEADRGKPFVCKSGIHSSVPAAVSISLPKEGEIGKKHYQNQGIYYKIFPGLELSGKSRVFS